MENLLQKIEDIPKDKNLVVFDLDGTLTESKSAIDDEMSELLGKLLGVKKVAIIGGGKYDQFQKQLLDKLKIPDDFLNNLFLFPLNGSSFYRYQNKKWQKMYFQELSAGERKKTHEAFERVLKEIKYILPERVYGEQIEDRGSQITFSVLGQNAPLDEKVKWSKKHDADRLRIVLKLQEYLPDMEVKIAGLTSIDVIRKGIDKKFAIEKLMEYLNISIADTLFVGDAFGPAGNDSPALESGILCFKVKSPQDTKNLIKHINKRAP